MNSTLTALASELAKVQAANAPIAEAYNEASPTRPDYSSLKRLYTRFSFAERTLINVAYRIEPQTPRDALILAILLLDEVEGDPEATDRYALAARGLVSYLAKAAGVVPDEFGLCLPALEQAGFVAPKKPMAEPTEVAI